MRTRSFAFAAAMALVSFAAAPAFADDARSTRQVSVSYEDLNLSSAAGAQTMIDRLEVAARDACRSAGHGLRGLDARRERRACEREAVSYAVAALDAPVVTARFEGAPVPIQTAAAW